MPVDVRRLLDLPTELADLEGVDFDLHKNLTWMLENDITDVLEETFSVVYERFGDRITVDLVEGTV